MYVLSYGFGCWYTFIVHPLRLWKLSWTPFPEPVGMDELHLWMLMCSWTLIWKPGEADASIDDTVLCWSWAVRSYMRRATKERCPVLSGTSAWNSSDAPVALKLWLVLFPSIPAQVQMYTLFLVSIAMCFFQLGHHKTMVRLHVLVCIEVDGRKRAFFSACIFSGNFAMYISRRWTWHLSASPWHVQ